MNFNRHITGKINKSRGLLFKLRQVLGKGWGLSPEMTIWAFRAVVVPMLTYGAIVWGVEAKRHAKEFNKLYWLAMVLSTFVTQSTQTAALGTILGVGNLIGEVEKRGLMGYIRSCNIIKESWNKIGHTKRVAHLLH